MNDGDKDPIENFLANRTNGEVVLIAFVLGVLLFAMGVVIGQALGNV